MLKTRTELYEAEERALRVMLEGEQEEERKREMEKKQKKEREKLLQQKLEMDSKLFGDPGKFCMLFLTVFFHTTSPSHRHLDLKCRHRSS